LTYQHALDLHGPVGLIRTLYTTDPGRAPFFTIAMLPFAYLFHGGPGMGMALNVVLWPVFLLSGGAIAKEFFDERARLIAIVLMSVLSEIAGLAHTQLQDFLLATLATLGVWLIIRTRHLQRWPASLGLGVVITLGTLTKLTFLIAIAGPLIVLVGAVGFDYFSARQIAVLRRPLFNVGLMAVVTVVPLLLWYVPNWAATRLYLNAALKQQPGTVPDPLSLTNVKAFAVNSIDNGFGLLIVLFTVVVALLSIPRLFAWLRTRDNFWPTVGVFLFLSSWLVIPLAAVVASTNQDPRYAVSSFPALAVIAAGLTSGIRWVAVRRGAEIAAVLIALNATLTVNVAGYKPPLTASTWSFNSPVGVLTAQLGADPSGGHLPMARNYGLEVLEYLEAHSKGPAGVVQPRTIAILELHGYLNGNDLPYLAELRHDPFTFNTLFATPKPSQLYSALKGSDFALYLRQPSTIPGGTGARVAQLNAVAAARVMTPQDFALFKPHPAKLFVGAGQEQGDQVAVLQRRS
jgi:hypothetical protein